MRPAAAAIRSPPRRSARRTAPRPVLSAPKCLAVPRRAGPIGEDRPLRTSRGGPRFRPTARDCDACSRTPSGTATRHPVSTFVGPRRTQPEDIDFRGPAEPRERLRTAAARVGEPVPGSASGVHEPRKNRRRRWWIAGGLRERRGPRRGRRASASRPGAPRFPESKGVFPPGREVPAGSSARDGGGRARPGAALSLPPTRRAECRTRPGRTLRPRTSRSSAVRRAGRRTISRSPVPGSEGSPPAGPGGARRPSARVAEGRARPGAALSPARRAERRPKLGRTLRPRPSRSSAIPGAGRRAISPPSKPLPP